MKRFLLILIPVFSVQQLSAQIHQPERFEVEMNYYDNYYNTISAGKDGIALVRESSERGKGNEGLYEVIMLDSSLNEQWVKTYSVPYDRFFRGYDYHKGSVILLFANKYNSSKNDLSLMKIDAATGAMEKFEIALEFMVDLSHFEMVGESAIFAGYVNYKPTVFLYNLREKRIIVLRGFYMDRSEIIQVDVDDKRDIFHVLATMRTLDRRNTVMMKSFDKTGELLINTILEPEEGYNLLYGRATTTNYGQQFIAGVFSKTKSAKDSRESYSLGIFIAKVDEWGEQTVNYYNYADLDNFFNYMKAARQKKVREKIERKKIKGQKIRFNYRLLVHDIIQKQDGSYIMVGEAYYPTSISRSEVSNSYSYAYPNILNSYKGFQYTHAVVVGFDSSGKLIWDNSFEINDVESLILEKFVKVDVRPNRIILCYNYNNVIRTKIIEGNKVIEGKTFNDIALKFSDDIAENPESMVGGLEEWYDNYFFAYGVQKIKKPDSRKREVFFVNKIYYK